MVFPLLLLLVTAPAAAAQTGSISGTISTPAKGASPIRVTIDQKVCGTELADEAILVDAQGHLANAVISVAGLKRLPAEDPSVTNE